MMKTHELNVDYNEENPASFQACTSAFPLFWESATDVMWCHILQLLSQDKNNFSLDEKYAACGMWQRVLWELGHGDIEQ